MPSCDDIPEGLFGRENFDTFIGWLHLHAHDRADRKALGKCWADFSKVHLTRDMWKRILDPPVVIGDV